MYMCICVYVYVCVYLCLCVCFCLCICVCVCILVCVFCVSMSAGVAVCGDTRTTFRILFSWALGIWLGSLGLCTKCLYIPVYLDSPRVPIAVQHLTRHRASCNLDNTAMCCLYLCPLNFPRMGCAMTVIYRRKHRIAKWRILPRVLLSVTDLEAKVTS